MKIEQLSRPVITDISSPRKSDNSFSSMLKESVEKVDALQKQADAAIDDLVVGNSKDIVQTMIMMEKADTIRNSGLPNRSLIICLYRTVPVTGARPITPLPA